MPAAPDAQHLPRTVENSAKILVTGAFGVGKTTLIGSVSEIEPLRTEEAMTTASMGIDDLAGLPDKATTTVAMDFGRITVTSSTVLYLFGMPGQRRFWGLWDGIAEGAIGALVLADTRRLEDSFDVIGQLEVGGKGPSGLPFAVAVNEFPGSRPHSTEDLRRALDLLPDTPIVRCDARDRGSSARALITLTRYALEAERSPA